MGSSYHEHKTLRLNQVSCCLKGSEGSAVISARFFSATKMKSSDKNSSGLFSCFSCYSSISTTLNVEGLDLKTVDCNWMVKENETSHHTSEFANTALVLRRGQTFDLQMKFQRKLHKEADKVILELNLGTNSQLVNATKLRCPLMASLDDNKWSMKMIAEDDDTFTYTFKVNIPPTALIGRYAAVVEFISDLRNEQQVTSRDKEPDVIILFNPWSKDDTVYLEDEAQREEYVLNDLGIIYRGSSRRISPKKWNFGQFEEGILECSLSLLDRDTRVKSKPSKWITRRGDPVWVSRIISAVANSCDEDGVLTGNWSGDYADGVSPTKWNGSVEILNQFYSTGKPVLFGQCWVFSGVVTTILRCLGIPTRSVTNFASAHDTEGSMTIDSYVDESGEEVELGGDSVWNFHVWNECWMKRVDLPPGYDGWQAVDATPQEVSLGLYQTGPAPLTAIKNGEVYVGYETGFVFAEVNSDRITWIVQQDENGDYTITGVGKRSPKSVGKFISTKAVGKDERHDLTLAYKHPENSEEERATFKKAYAFGSKPDYQMGFLAVHEEGEGITLDFSASPSEHLRNGDGFSVLIKVQNDATENKTVDLSAVLHSTKYTGEKKMFIKRQRFSAIPLEANETKAQEFTVLFSDYDGRLVDLNSMRLSVVAKVKETKKIFADQYEFQLDNKDAIDIKLDAKQLQVGKNHTVAVNITNPLPIRLTGVTVTLEGPGLSSPLVKKLNRNIVAGGTAQVSFQINPKRPGKRSFLVDVDAKQVKDVKSYLDVDVIQAQNGN